LLQARKHVSVGVVSSPLKPHVTVGSPTGKYLWPRVQQINQASLEVLGMEKQTACVPIMSVEKSFKSRGWVGEAYPALQATEHDWPAIRDDPVHVP
jgi:hypothetical protein